MDSFVGSISSLGSFEGVWNGSVECGKTFVEILLMPLDVGL